MVYTIPDFPLQRLHVPLCKDILALNCGSTISSLLILHLLFLTGIIERIIPLW
jgi:hypothetical protein